MWTYTSADQKAVSDGNGMFVPCDPANSDWRRIMESGESIAPFVPPPPPVPDIAFAQLLTGLVAQGWITEAEGSAWLAGMLPAAVTEAINALPVEQRFAAKARALRPSVIVRADPLVTALGATQARTPAQIDAFFIFCASL